MRDVLIFGLVLTACLFAIRKPFVGMLSYVALGLIGPHSFAWGFARTLPMAQMVVVSTFLGLIMFPPKVSLPKGREVGTLAALFFLFCVSTLFAVAQEQATTKLLEVSKMYLMVLVIMVLVQTKDDLWWFLRVVALCLGFLGLKGGIWSILTGGQHHVYGPEETFLYANNAIGLALAMNLPVLFYLYKVETRKWLKLLFLTMFICSYPAIICTFSRGAWLGASAVTIMICWYTRYRIVTLMSGGLMAIILGVSLLTFDLVPDRVQQRFDQFVNYKEESSAQSRFWSWEFCRRVGFAKPLTGAGFNYYSRDMYAQYYPEFIDQYTGETFWSCHSMWFTVLGEQGMLGMALWLTLLGSIIFGLKRMLKSPVVRNEKVLYSFVRMFMGVFWVYMIVGTFLDVAYFEFFFQMVAAFICLKAIVRELQRQSLEREEGLATHSFDRVAHRMW
jgi:probable O-glycosylation ligase (exosortase A-associated)